VAEQDHPFVTLTDGAGVCQIVAVIETTQTEPHPEGGTSPLVVRLRLVNTTGKTGTVRYMRSNGQLDTAAVLPGENVETTISPPRRVGLHRIRCALTWG
jgi:hypothetical protein